jgi:serine protease DegQ
LLLSDDIKAKFFLKNLMKKVFFASFFRNLLARPVLSVAMLCLPTFLGLYSSLFPFSLETFSLETTALAQDPASEAAISGAKAAAKELSLAFEEAAKSITPSVVNISAIKKPKSSKLTKNPNDPFFDQFRDFFGDDFLDRFQGAPDGNGPGSGRGESPGQQGLGTGVIVDTRGYILTNNHVVEGADELRVRLNEDQTVKAELIGTDPRTDLAVIKIKAADLKAAKLGSSEHLKIGEWVVDAGNPFGLDNTITAGIVSAKGRSLQGGGQFEDFIQTDAAINPGNSGGALVDTRGHLIGINTAIYSNNGGSMGIGFAIPVNLAKQVMESILNNGSVTRGWIGVEPQNLSKELSESLGIPKNTAGVLLSGVLEGGPAARGGIKPGDVLIAVNGKSTKDVRQLLNQIAQISPGNEATLKILRKDKELELKVQAGKRPKPKTIN